MKVFRLCRAPFRALDGEGARLYGGRWNNPGRAVIYTSGTLALAALEYLVHVDAAGAPADLVAMTIEFPDDLEVESVPAASLPNGWERAMSWTACQAIGDAWLASGRAFGLRVPSAAIPEESNVLLNPRLPGARRLRVVAERPFAYDPRLLA